MVWAIVVGIGAFVGLLVGRWWTLVGAIGLGAWIAATTGVDEVPPWFLGVAYGAFAALGIGCGVLLRRRVSS